MAGTKVYFKDILLTLTYVKTRYGWLARTTSKLIPTKLFRYVQSKKEKCHIVVTAYHLQHLNACKNSPKMCGLFVATKFPSIQGQVF